MAEELERLIRRFITKHHLIYSPTLKAELSKELAEEIRDLLARKCPEGGCYAKV